MKTQTIDVAMELITPELAQQYLSHNTNNRNLRAAKVTAYAKDMQEGRWEQNGESIKFSQSGRLDDGQHRLMAIVESGVTIPMLVVKGLTSRAQDTIDSGVPRKFSDVLTLHHEKDTAMLGAAVRSIYLWQNVSRTNFGGPAGQATTVQLVACLEANPWIRDEIPLIRRLYTYAKLPASISGALVYAFNEVDPGDAQYFFERLVSDEGHRAGEPIYTLRKLLLASTDVRGSRNLRYLAAVTIKAWNKYRLGETCDQLRFRSGGANPEPFPEVK